MTRRRPTRRSRREPSLRSTLTFVRSLGPRRERLYANRAALTYHGLNLDEWVHGSFRSEVHPDDADRLKGEADRALLTGSAFELELRLHRHDRSYRWFLSRYHPLRDDIGQVVRWYVACTDIEDRKRAEERLHQENVALREEVAAASMFEEIVGRSPALRTVLSRVSKVAPGDSTVLVTGETGTGKELVARAIHRRSRRGSRPFVAVNCAPMSARLDRLGALRSREGGLHRSHPTAAWSVRTGTRRNDFLGRSRRTVIRHTSCVPASAPGA